MSRKSSQTCGNGPGSLGGIGEQSVASSPSLSFLHFFFISFEIVLFGEGVGVTGG